MADDHDAFATKILLMRAENRSRAKSWLTAALGDEPVAQKNDTSSNTVASDELAEIQGVNELSGIGALKTGTQDDDISDRNLISANDALRRKLLRKDAYQKFQLHGKGTLNAPKPMPKSQGQIQVSDDSEEDAAKGRSKKISPNQNREEHDRPSSPNVADENQIASNLRRKKRPGSYLDQLLASRGGKKKKKQKAKAQEAND